MSHPWLGTLTLAAKDAELINLLICEHQRNVREGFRYEEQTESKRFLLEKMLLGQYFVWIK
jgi:hypothetical protein